MYEIIIKPSALKELNKLPNQMVKKISIAIDNLSKEPRPSGN